MIDVVLAHGNEGATVEAVIDRAGVDEDTFAQHFDSIQDCILDAYWAHTNEFTVLVQAAFDREAVWRDSLRAAAYAAARYMRDNPRIVRFGTLQLFQAGPMAQAARESHLHRMVDLLDRGRQELDDPSSLSRGVAEGIFGSIYELVVRDLQSGRGTRAATDFVPEMMYLAVRPYLGQEAALEELSIPPPPEDRDE
ncbi:MAG TPA: TetR/AcrR family transcriptional regulator [Solirubrobacterales bacterium]